MVRFTEAVLTWWRINGNTFPTWALAARIVFAIRCKEAELGLHDGGPIDLHMDNKSGIDVT
jgi:hypothetical protein